MKMHPIKSFIRQQLWLKRLNKHLGDFSGHQGGAIAVMFALMLPVIIGFAGLGIDAGLWYKDRRSMQTATDAAAVSAAIERTYGANSAEILSIATIEATRNGFDSSIDTITVNNPPASGDFSGPDYDAYVQVIINHPLDTFLSSVITSIIPTSVTTAVATTSGDQDACLLSLATTGSNGVYMNGAMSTVDMTGCGVVANSSDGLAVHVQNGTFGADCVWSVGGIDGTINTSADCVKQSGVSAVTDPYADLIVPSYSACDETGNYSPSGTVTNTGTKVICGDFSLDGTVDLEPGIYIVDCGSISINGGAIVTGDDVTIILTKNLNTCGANFGSVTINGGANVTLSAVDTDDDPYEGVLFFQDPAAGSSKNFSLNGGSTTELSGAVYVPNNDIEFSGGNDTVPSGCLMLVAQKVSFSGTADIENDCDMYGGNPINYGAVPGLVE
ncbi:MAG: hypothetical protein KAI73_03330 [Rhodospirillaceae bacterium]|nr:hypothetical protein [Rhodospirillaceae bacterium]